MAAPSVWIVNKGSHPYHHAEKFGTTKVLTEGRVNVFALDNLKHEIETKLEEGAAKEGDYLLLSGYNLPNMIAGHWFLKKFGKCKLLVWGANRQKYMVLTWHEEAEKG